MARGYPAAPRWSARKVSRVTSSSDDLLVLCRRTVIVVAAEFSDNTLAALLRERPGKSLTVSDAVAGT